MSIPVNLYVDRMSPTEPVRIADVYAVTNARGPAYDEAARKIGLTRAEYAEFRRAISEGGATFVRLPRHIDAMAGIHRRNGQVYALRNVLVPSGTMGWEVPLADGTTVIVPQICGNLSMNRPRVMAQRAPRLVARVQQPHAVRAAVFTAPAAHAVAMIPETPVVFVPPAAAPVVAAPAAVPVAAAAHGVPFLGALFPGVGAIIGVVTHHGSTPSTPLTVPVSLPTPLPPPPCAAGSNEFGVCQQ